MKSVKFLCKPAKLYLFLSVFLLLSMIIQNLGKNNVLCFGPLECYEVNKITLLLIKLLYIGFWTFILQMICKGGYTNVSWALVLLPIILFGLTLVMYMLNRGVMEGFNVNKRIKKNLNKNRYLNKKND
jgi:hypothetical protein